MCAWCDVEWYAAAARGRADNNEHFLKLMVSCQWRSLGLLHNYVRRFVRGCGWDVGQAADVEERICRVAVLSRLRRVVAAQVVWTGWRERQRCEQRAASLQLQPITRHPEGAICDGEAVELLRGPTNDSSKA